MASGALEWFGWGAGTVALCLGALSVWLDLRRRKNGSERVTDGAGGLAIEDGFGNVALMCDEPACDLHVVRPGKFQCNAVGPLCPDVPGGEE